MARREVVDAAAASGTPVLRWTGSSLEQLSGPVVLEDGAGTLLQAAAAYEDLAGTVEAMAGVGGRLVGTDDGFLHVAYHRAAP